MEQGIDHQRVGIGLFGQANLGRARLSHAFGVESAGLAVPADGDPQRERVKAGAKHLASGFDEAFRKVQCGTVEPAHGQRISDREQRGNRLGEIAGEAKHAAILRRLRHRKVRLMTGKRGVRLRPVQSGVDDGPSNLLRDGRVMKFECEVGLADTEQGAVWLLARLLE
jgi:hypothetical protein